MSKSTPDVSAFFKDVLGAFPVDASAFEDAFKTSATLNEKLSAVALTAAEKSTDLSNNWAQETFSKLLRCKRIGG